MKILLAIVCNGLILFGMHYFMPNDIAADGWLKLYFIGGVVLGLLNTVVKPILNVLGFPFILLTFGLFLLVINGVILILLQRIIEALHIAGVRFLIEGWGNLVIAVVIFTIFNTIYHAFFKR